MSRHCHNPSADPLPHGRWGLRRVYVLRLLAGVCLFTAVSGKADETDKNAQAPDLPAEKMLPPGNDPDRAKPYQVVSAGKPPQPPTAFDPDPNQFRLPPSPLSPSLDLQSRPEPNQTTYSFNPDPGAMLPTKKAGQDATIELNLMGFYRQDPVPAEPLKEPPSINRLELVVTTPPQPVDPRNVPLDEGLKLPREDVRSNERLSPKFHTPEYPEAHAAKNHPKKTHPRLNRWQIPFVYPPTESRPNEE